MAADIQMLLRQHLVVKSPIVLVGHDIGTMVAYAFVSSFPKSVERVVRMEGPLPGTLAYYSTIATTHLINLMNWHFLHNGCGQQPRAKNKWALVDAGIGTRWHFDLLFADCQDHAEGSGQEYCSFALSWLPRKDPPDHGDDLGMQPFC